MSDVEILKRRLEREIAARKQAEYILDEKALELYQANLQLLRLNESLEQKVEERSRQVEESELRYRQIIDSAIDFIYETNGNGVITLANPVVIKSLGLKDESEVLGKNFAEFVPKTHRQQVLFFYLQKRQEKEERSLSVVPVVGGGGEWIWIEQNVQYFYDTKGSLYRVSVVGRDVTSRVLSEKELTKATLRLTSLISNLNAGILLEDEERRVVLANKKFCSIFNIPLDPETLVGADCSKSAEDSKHLFEEPEKFTHRIEVLLRKQETETREELQMKDGTVLLRDYIPIFDEDAYMGHLWHYTDITEEKNQEKRLKLSEEKYRGLIENMELGLLEVDTKGVIIRAYQRFCAMTGYEENELIGASASDLLLPPEYEPVMQRQEAERMKGQAGVYEIEILKKNGQRIWVLISGAPFYNDQGEIVGSLGIHYDISARKKLEEELKIASDKAEKAMLAEKQFLANMSHEIRNPINAIVGMTNLMRDTELSAQQSQYTKTIKFSTDILLGLISGILDLSKIEAGQYELSAQPVDIRAMTEGIVKSFESNVDGKKINFFTDISSEVPEILVADPTALNQIFINLVGNAAKFTDKGFVVIAAKVMEKNDSTVSIEFSVWDTGIGIAKEKQVQIFESFRQADKETKLKYGGTGLGLSIVKHLIAIMGGTIQVESEIGEGTTFRFTLKFPIGKIADLDDTLTVEASLPDIERVLIVEDSDINQQYLSGLFSKWKIGYDIASNGVEALKFVENNTYNFILMDIRMPKMDGYETTIRIRNATDNPNCATPIIALTASALVDERNKALECGMNYHLTKPFTPQQLMKALRSEEVMDREEKEEAFEFSDQLDKEQLKLIYGNDVERASIIFKIFTDIISEELDMLKKMEMEGETTAFIRKVHKISPNFAMVGLTPLTELLIEVENEGKKKGMSALLKKKFKQFLDQVDPQLRVVENEFKRMKTYLLQ